MKHGNRSEKSSTYFLAFLLDQSRLLVQNAQEDDANFGGGSCHMTITLEFKGNVCA